jgi:hypothetical protein
VVRSDVRREGSDLPRATSPSVVARRLPCLMNRVRCYAHTSVEQRRHKTMTEVESGHAENDGRRSGDVGNQNGGDD